MTVDVEEAIHSPNKSFIQLFETQVDRYYDRVFIRYQASSDRLEFKTLTYGQFNCMANYLAHEWYPLVKNIKYIGFLGGESVQCLLAMLAIFKLRRVFFAISTHVPESLITKLLLKADTQYLIVSEEYRSIARETTKKLPNIQVQILETFDMERLARLATGFDDNNELLEDTSTETLTDIVFMLHSSGSTGVPKPLKLTNSWVITLLQGFVKESSIWGNLGIESTSAILPMTPLFHTTGVVTHLMSIMFGSCAIALRKLPPSSQVLLSTIKKYNPDIIFVSPVILNDLAAYLQSEILDNETIMDAFSQIKVCLYGGDQLLARSAEILITKGLNVRSAHGLTELGPCCIADVLNENKYWDAIRPFKVISSYARWEPFDDGIYHLMIRADWPGLSPSAPINNNGYFETTDLFRKHPLDASYWLHIGRMHDILMMKDGKKTYPVPIEREIRNASIIRHCTVIGQNRPCTAVLIELNTQYSAQFDHENIISEVHRLVRNANKIASRHSVIAVPKMVYILPPNKKLKLISKGTVSRKEALQDFEKEIEKMYDE